MREPGRNTRDRQGDLHAGRRLALALESLGERLAASAGLPPVLRPQAEALAQGRSRVPADGAAVDWVSRVRDGLPVGLQGLRGWLGTPLTVWLEERRGSPEEDAAQVALEARTLLKARHEDAARAYCRWFSAAQPEGAQGVFAVASELGLGEAVDRFCALGCEGDLGRQVGVWQRAAAGWAESALGSRVAVPVGELGRLKALHGAVGEAERQGVPPGGVAAWVASQLGWTLAEVEALLKLQRAVVARTDPRETLRPRWALVRPVAEAVASLERDLGRMPTLDEIAERAGSHRALVELCLEALDERSPG
ncbi:MAG: hypothetical protein HY909_02975 [Deltaproteobacteria bacterium]|nr:hypothetical protein [Deltaproteobacteria bacterium]